MSFLQSISNVNEESGTREEEEISRTFSWLLRFAIMELHIECYIVVLNHKSPPVDYY